jgi:hypothetical protein
MSISFPIHLEEEGSNPANGSLNSERRFENATGNGATLITHWIISVQGRIGTHRLKQCGPVATQAVASTWIILAPASRSSMDALFCRN